MKRLLCLLLALCLLPLFALAEDDDEDLEIEEIIEDVMLDDDGNEILVDEDTGEALILSSLDAEKLEELDEQYEIDDTVDPDTLEINPNLPDHIINILLIGVDVRGTGSVQKLADQEKYSKRSDVVMILSIDTQAGTLKLSSIARNTYVEIPGRKNKSIIANSYGNAIYENGEYSAWNDTPELVVRTVNHNFELNIEHYVAINFYGVAEIVEALGGVDIDLTKVEARAINTYLSMRKITNSDGKVISHGKEIAKTYDSKKGKHDALEAKAGVQHLDGLQALMYARLRSIDNDFVRTSRVRHLLDCLLQQVLAKVNTKELDVFSLLTTSIDYMITNMKLSAIGQIATQVLSSGLLSQVGQTDSLIEQFRIPMDGTYSYETVNGASVTFMNSANFQKNKEALHEFIYGSYIPAT